MKLSCLLGHNYQINVYYIGWDLHIGKQCTCCDKVKYLYTHKKPWDKQITECVEKYKEKGFKYTLENFAIRHNRTYDHYY